jgi:predicted transcriptional regulator
MKPTLQLKNSTQEPKSHCFNIGSTEKHLDLSVLHYKMSPRAYICSWGKNKHYIVIKQVHISDPVAYPIIYKYMFRYDINN